MVYYLPEGVFTDYDLYYFTKEEFFLLFQLSIQQFLGDLALGYVLVYFTQSGIHQRNHQKYTTPCPKLQTASRRTLKSDRTGGEGTIKNSLHKTLHS